MPPETQGFNLSFDLGDVVTILSFLLTLAAFHTNNRERITRIETKVDLMWHQLKNRLNINDE